MRRQDSDPQARHGGLAQHRPVAGLVLVDFGLARTIGKQGLLSPALTELITRFSDGERLTQVGAIAGTRGYTSPEQVCGIDADALSDQFTSCAALYEALYGQLPFADQTFEEYAAV